MWTDVQRWNSKTLKTHSVHELMEKTQKIKSQKYADVINNEC